MKMLLIIIVTLSLSISSYAQFFIKKNRNHKIEIGQTYHDNWGYFKDNDYNKYYYLDFIISQQLGYFISQNISFGGVYSFSISTSNFLNIPFKKSVGVYSKLYFPKTINSRYFKKIDFFAELSISISNYYFVKDKNIVFFSKDIEKIGLPVVSNKTDQLILEVPIGIKYHFSDNLVGEFSVKYYKNISKTNEKSLIIPQIGLDYYLFSDKNNDTDKRIKKHKKKNNDFLNSFIFGSSICYFNMTEYQLANGADFSWYVYIWNMNVATSLTKKIYAGIQVFNIFTGNINKQKKRFSIAGLFIQYDFLKAKKDRKKRMFADISLNTGNFFTGGELDPVFRPKTHYIGFGFGFDIPLNKISKHLYLDLSGYRYFMLNKIKTGSDFTQYIVGLNYHFGKRVQEKWH